MAQACVKMRKWGISGCADIHCLWFMRKALPLTSGTPVGNQAKSWSPAVASVKLCIHTRKSTQTMCFLMSGPEWNYSWESHQQAGSAYYDVFVKHTPAYWTCMYVIEEISHIFLLSRGSFIRGFEAFFFFHFSLMDLKRERGHKDRLNLLSLWMESLISCVLICWNKSLSNLGHSQNRPFNMT